MQTSIDTQAWLIGMAGLALVARNPRETYAFVRSFFTTKEGT